MLTASQRQLAIQQLELEFELDKRLCKKSFSHFIKTFWKVVEPKRDYQHNWHIDALCEHLQAVRDGKIKNLIIMIPPGHMKSLTVAVFFPAWIWIEEADKRFIFSSYSQPLSTRDSIKCRQLIESTQYQQMFNPKWELADDQNQKTRFNTTHSGFRIASSVDGVSTGERGDYLVVDDPLKAVDAESENARENVITWWDGAMSSRDGDPKNTHRIIIMQRLHEEDLAGHCEKSGDYVVLRLPAEYDSHEAELNEKKNPNPIGWKDPRKVDGELLWPERFTPEHQDNAKKTLGSMGYSAQQQQKPTPKEGGLFKKHWWQEYEKSPSPILETVQFWDCAQKPGITNDFSVCSTWARTPNGFYILDVWREKTDAPYLEAMAKAKFAEFRPNAVVIEDKSAGSSLIQYLLHQTTIPVFPFDPGQRDKQVRAAAATPTVEAKKVSLPKDAKWRETFISEHEKFPNTKHDDQVDTTSMAVEYFQSRVTNNQPKVRRL